LNVRISTIAVCFSSWLLAGSATAAGPFAGPGKGAIAQFRSSDRELLQPVNTLPIRFSRLRGNARHWAPGQQGFPALPPMENLDANGTIGPVADIAAPFAVNTEPSDGAFRFDRHSGAVVREIPRGYRRMCDSLSGHVWNEPDGRRICFDTRGKPGIAIQIPIN
jgi:hypothetical protein